MRFLSLLLVAAILVACGGPAQPGATPTIPGLVETPTGGDGGEEGQVVISHATWDYERPMLEPLVRQFEEQNPNIKVVLVPLDDMMQPSDPNQPETALSALRRIASGEDTAPAFAIPPEALGTSLLLDLKPLMDADATFDSADFYPGALARWSKDGGIWALPRTFYVSTLSYNRDLFQAAGLPAPKPGWTWDDVLAAAEQIQKSGGPNIVGMADSSGGSMQLAAMLTKRGVKLFGPGSENVQLTDPVFEESIGEVIKLFKSGVLVNPYNSTPDKPVDPQQLLRDGVVGIWGEIAVYGPDGTPEPLPYAVGRVPYPVLSGLEPFFSGGAEGYMVSGGTASPEAAWKWVEFLTRQPMSQPGMTTAFSPGQIPARKALADATNYWASLDEESAGALRWTLENSTPVSSQATDYTLFSGINQALSTVLSDPKADLGKALLDAQRMVDESRAQAAANPTPVPDVSPVLVATPEPQVAPEGAITITYGVYGSNPSELRRILRGFREEHPEIFVQLKNTDTYTTSPKIADLASQADCFAWPMPLQGTEDTSSLLDLRPLMDADATFPRDDLPVALMSAFERDGGMYGLPYAFNIRTLTYNRKIFTDAGVTPPGKRPLTLDEFVQLAEAVSSGEGEERTHGYVSLGGIQSDLPFFVSVLGGRMSSGQGSDLRPIYTDPETLKAISWYLDLSQVKKVSPELSIGYGPNKPGEDNSYAIIQAGRAAMWFDYGKSSFGMPIEPPTVDPRESGIVQPVSLDLGVAPLPVGEGGLGRGDLYARGFHISKSTKQPQACWELIKYLSTDLSQIYGDIPARASVAQSEEYKAIAAPDRLEILDIYSEALGRPLRAGEDPNTLWMLDPYWMLKAISNVVEQGGDLSAEMEVAQRLTTAYAECIAPGKKQPYECAREADPEYDGYNVEPQPGVPMGDRRRAL